jgi:hypothetical protein
VSEQSDAERFATLASARFPALLRLSTAKHIYDPAPGSLNAITDKWVQSSQPYKDLARFTVDERIMGSIIDPGLTPIAKAISRDVLGQRTLVTRRIAPKENDRGAIAHLVDYGIRVRIYRDEEAKDTILVWECLYGVA